MRSIIEDFPHILHGADYNPDQWLDAPGVIDEDFRLMHVTGCNTMAIGVFAWARLEPEEGVYDFGWLDRMAGKFEREGVNLILATPTGAKPFWMSERYEEIRRVNAEGQRERSGRRHNHCWTSPVFRQKVLEMNTRLAERYGKHPALKLWHVSNEYNGECFCPLCLTSFRDWLKRRYQTLEAINKAYWADFWAHRIVSWEQLDPRNKILDGLALDWRRFVSWQVEDFYLWETAPLRQASPQVPMFTNLMGFCSWVDYRALARHMDVIGDDSYPGFDGDNPELATSAAGVGMRFDMLRCLKGKPQPWFLMESCIDGRQIWGHIKLKFPGMHHLEMLQAIAHGANGTLYFQWRKGRGGVEKFHGAVLHHNHIEETRSFLEVKSLSARYQKLDGLLPSLNSSRVALLSDWESRWAWGCSMGVPDRNEDSLVHYAASLYLPFWKRGISVDVLGSTDDFSTYEVLLAPRLYLLLPGVAERLRQFVAAGGTLIMTAMSGLVNETNQCFADSWPGDGLQEVLGAWMEEPDWMNPGQERTVSGLGQTWKTGRLVTVIHAVGAEVLYEYNSSWMNGAPAITRHRYGQGAAYFLGCDLDPEGLDAFIASITRDLALGAFYPDARPLPHGISAVRRASADTNSGDFWFLLNFTPNLVPVDLPATITFIDYETAHSTSPQIDLAPWEARILQATA